MTIIDVSAESVLLALADELLWSPSTTPFPINVNICGGSSVLQAARYNAWQKDRKQYLVERKALSLAGPKLKVCQTRHIASGRHISKGS